MKNTSEETCCDICSGRIEDENHFSRNYGCLNDRCTCHTSEPNSLKWEELDNLVRDLTRVGGIPKSEARQRILALLSQQKEEFKKMCGEVEVLEYPDKKKISCEKAYTYGQMNMLLRIINKINENQK